MPKRYPVREFTGTVGDLEQFLQEQSAKGLNLVGTLFAEPVANSVLGERRYGLIFENLYG